MVEVAMKKMIVGMMMGAAMTTVFACGGAKCFKKAKKKISTMVEKILS
jgi:hypothetical protein